MAKIPITLTDFLRDARLGEFEIILKEQGVVYIEHLQDVTEEILISDVGMKKPQARRLLKNFGKLFNLTGSADTSGENQSRLRKEVHQIQDRKTSLEIKYQLFTNQNPQSRRIGPFSTDQILYCDLVNIICGQERNELGKDMTVELYTCEGYPLSTRPISYISKLSDWCLEEYPDTPLLYAVPRLKCYTDKCTQYMTAAPLCDGIDHIFIRNTECDFKRTFRTNCSKATYFQLMSTIHDMTGIPGHLFRLYQNGKHLHSTQDGTTLCNLSIFDQTTLNMKIDNHFWTLGKDKNFSLPECKPTWHMEQSTFGTSFFFSCLYSLAHWMAKPDQRSSVVFYQTLGHIRSMTGCPPLIHALHIMFRNETLTLPHRVAIQECLVLLFKTIIPKNKKLHSSEFEIINENKVTDFSNYFWFYLIHYSNNHNLNTEKYDTANLTCSVTFKRMTDPVLVEENGLEHIVDRQTLREENMNLIRYLYNYKRMAKSFIGDEAIIWKHQDVPTCGVDLTDEWTSLTELCSNLQPLSIQSPSDINATCPAPSMIPLENGNIGVYLSMSRKGLKPFIYYDVITGNSINFDVQELQLHLKNNPPLFSDMMNLPKDVQNITREPDEIIMVILDGSGSMNHSYLDGKSKFHSVVEASLAFRYRTEAYELNNAIGLAYFAKGCSLKYEFSDNIKGFTDQLPVKSIGGGTAIYDAIKFAAVQFEKFANKYPNYKIVHRRILCLTDGEDNCSSITPKKVTSLLENSKIILDCVLFSKRIVAIHKIAKDSGGYSFQPANSREMLNIFELETMLSMKCRPHCTTKPRTHIPWPLDTEPAHVLPEKLNIKVQTIHMCLSRALIQKQLNTHTNENLAKRILKELSYYQANPHPAFEVFPGEEHIDFWRIIMEGPEYTPYEGVFSNSRIAITRGIFELFIEFSDEYPAKPPNIRFLTPIFHCNINSSGRICHTILDRFYAPGVRIGDVFNHVYGLLCSPEEEDPLDSVKANLLHFDKETYLEEARSHTEKNALVPKSTVRINLLGGEQNPRVNYPEHLVCPLTLQLFKDPVATLNGDTYEREAIMEHLKDKKYDPFSFEPLNANDLWPNNLVKRLVAEYIQVVGDAALI